MKYVIGVDLGTTFAAAATWRERHAEIVTLGGRAAAIPSVLLLRDDGEYLAGEAASRRAVLEPQRVAREFKRRLGDTTPIMLGGTPVSAEALMARLLRAVVDEVTTREGGAPAKICVCHPANWGTYKTDLLGQAVRLAGLDLPVTYTTEPEAAAAFYAQQQRIEPGSVVAVYDLGGGTFDAAVLRKTATGFEILGRPEGIERLGGIDFDAAVFAHVVKALGPKLAELDEDDSVVVAAVARLREECVAAKEALSVDTDASIAVVLPNVTTEVRLTRAELEAMVRPALLDTVAALKRAVDSAGVADAVHSVLLVGGSSRMPIVSQLVASELGYPVAVDAHPKHAVALGAAWIASGEAAQPPAPARVEARFTPVAVPPVSPSPVVPVVPVAIAAPAPANPFAPGKASVPTAPRASSSAASAASAPTALVAPSVPRRPPLPPPPPPGPSRPSGRGRLALIAVAATALLAAAVFGVMALLNNGRGTVPTSSSSSEVPAATQPVDPTTDPTGTAPATQEPPPVTYPNDPEAYALAAVRAWADGDGERLGQLVDDGAGIFDTLSAGNYNKQFSVYQCTGPASESLCMMFNKPGDILRLHVRNNRLGKANAVVSGEFEPITFPEDLQAYAQEALEDWRLHNTNAVALLTKQPGDSAFDAVPGDRRGSTWTYVGQDGAAGHIYHIWGNEAGEQIVFGFANPDVEAPPANRHHLIQTVDFRPGP